MKGQRTVTVEQLNRMTSADLERILPEIDLREVIEDYIKRRGDGSRGCDDCERMRSRVEWEREARD